MNGPVYALAQYDTLLIAAGDFTEPAKYIAAWNGSSWSPLGTGMDWRVMALAVYDGKLIAGGGFTTAGGMPASCIAQWDGSSWSPLGAGTSNFVYALTAYGTDLVAGGGFTMAGGSPAGFIAAWNGASWSSLGAGTNNWIYSLASYDSKLIAGGVFTEAGGVPALGIAGWNGLAWETLGTGMNNYVYCLGVHDDRLFAGGFTSAGGVALNNIEVWNGTSWSPLGSGTNGYVYALASFDTALAAGGVFTSAGEKSSLHFALWTKREPATAVENSVLARRVGSAIEVVWRLSEFIGRDRFIVERAAESAAYRELEGAKVDFDGFQYACRDESVKEGTAYRYRIGLRGADNSPRYLFETEEIAMPDLPLTLFQNHPNPFNPSTTIRFYLPEAATVSLKVYAVDGRLVATLMSGERQERGHQSVAWNGRNSRGEVVASGAYFYRLCAGEKTQSKKLIVLR